MKSWPVRLGMLAFLVVTYIFLWRPVRVSFTVNVVRPVLAPQAEIMKGVSFNVDAGNNTAQYYTGGGAFLLFPGMVFLLLGLWKPVLKLFGAHLIAGFLIFGCFWIGVDMDAGGLIKLGEFMTSYLVTAGSIGYMVVILTENKKGRENF